MESPNTPFDGDQEFSQTTSGAGGSLQSPSEVDSGSQEKRHSTISRELVCPLCWPCVWSGQQAEIIHAVDCVWPTHTHP